MSEQELCEEFGKYGPLASVKIMYPRSEEEKAKGRLTGFVGFMRRSDAEDAYEALKGSLGAACVSSSWVVVVRWHFFNNLEAWHFLSE